MNKRLKINLNEVSKAQDFVRICSKYEEDINVYSGRQIIDAKSLLGIFSLNLSENIETEILTVNNETFEHFQTEMVQFEVS